MFFRIASATLLLLLMLSIFILSDQDAVESANTSSGIIKKILSVFVLDFENLPLSEQNEMILSFSFAARKTAHFLIYTLLGIFSFLTFVTYKNLHLSFRMSISAIVCILYAVSDEIHQLFVVGRSGEVRDVLIDSIGSFVGIASCYLFCRIFKKIYSKIK